MQTVNKKQYEDTQAEWKPISLVCRECGKPALGRCNKLGLVQSQQIYYPCGHIQFIPPDLSIKKRTRRKRQKKTLFEM